MAALEIVTEDHSSDTLSILLRLQATKETSYDVAQDDAAVVATVLELVLVCAWEERACFLSFFRWVLGVSFCFDSFCCLVNCHTLRHCMLNTTLGIICSKLGEMLRRFIFTFSHPTANRCFAAKWGTVPVPPWLQRPTAVCRDHGAWPSPLPHLANDWQVAPPVHSSRNDPALHERLRHQWQAAASVVP